MGTAQVRYRERWWASGELWRCSRRHQWRLYTEIAGERIFGSREGKEAMRVLVLTQVVVYPADAGPKIKTLQVLRYLSARHEVTYCTFVRSEQEARDAEKLR